MEESLPIKINRELKGKVHTVTSAVLENISDLGLYYTPGVYDACLEVKTDNKKSFEFTRRQNTVAVLSNGSQVSGFGDMGSVSVMPLIESKAMLFKILANIDAVPLSISSGKADVFANTIMAIKDNFVAFDVTNVSDDISLGIRELLVKSKIPVFDDEVEGLVPVVYAGIKNAVKALDKNPETIKIVIDGASLFSLVLSKILVKAGYRNIIVCDKKGAIYRESANLSGIKEEIAGVTNENNEKGKLSAILKNADIVLLMTNQTTFVPENIAKMNENPVVFTLSYPIPAIMPDNAEKAGAKIVSSLRNDRPNQVINAIAFPGLLKGVVMAKATRFTDEMLIACGDEIAEYVQGEDFCSDYLLPSPLDEGLADRIAVCVSKAAKKSKANK